MLKSHIKKKKSNVANEGVKEFLNSSMPISLPTQQGADEPFSRYTIKTGGGTRKTTNSALGHSVAGNPQMRYRQQKTPSITGGRGIDDLDFIGPIGSETTGADTNMAVRHKKNQQYVSMNVTQALVNNSLDMNNQTYSTIAAGQSSKNVVQLSMNQRQIEHLTANLNKT